MSIVAACGSTGRSVEGTGGAAGPSAGGGSAEGGSGGGGANGGGGAREAGAMPEAKGAVPVALKVTVERPGAQDG